MSKPEKSKQKGVVFSAEQVKQAHRSETESDIAQLEADLLADIAAFDLEAAQRQARSDEARARSGSAIPQLVFPQITSTAALQQPSEEPVVVLPKPSVQAPAPGGLLAELRSRAERLQAGQHLEMAQRTAVNETIDQALRSLFAYLHEFVAQLNIVKPLIGRTYPLIDDHQLSGLEWQEGFADYRVQSQSAGALVDVASLSYQLRAPKGLAVSRDGVAVERFRTLLFDYGLQFDCKEFKNERRYVERAEFTVPGQLSVNIRWRADFTAGRIMLETRNLERLGSASYSVLPGIMNQTLFDEFGRLVLGEPNTFREMLRRAHQAA